MPKRNFDIVRFHFETPLHIGNERSDYSTGSAFLHSDALYAAICHAWAKIGHPEWIPAGESAHTVLSVSSLFPYIDYPEGSSYFLPRPYLLFNKKEEDTQLSTSVRKSLKKVQWVDIPVFEALAGGAPPDIHQTFFDQGFQSVKPLPSAPMGGNIQPFSAQVVPRAAVSRTGETDTVIYYISRYYFHPDAGLYAFIQTSTPDVRSRLITALELLQEEGLGTDRNVGNGKFRYSFSSVSIDLPEQADYGMNLGMYCPADKSEWLQFSEMNEAIPRSGYTIVRRGGWLSEPHNTWRKRSVYMVQPGSILFTRGMDIAGKVVNLEPVGEGINTGHQVWRNGRSIFLPCKG